MKKVALKSVKSEDPASTFYKKLKRISDGNMSTRNYIHITKSSYEKLINALKNNVELKTNAVVAPLIKIKAASEVIKTARPIREQAQAPVTTVSTFAKPVAPVTISSEEPASSSTPKVIDFAPQKPVGTSGATEVLPIKLPNTSRFEEFDPNADSEVTSNVTQFIPSAENIKAQERLKTTT